MIKNYSKLCPKCGKEIFYASERTRDISANNNTVCNSCRNTGKGNPCYGKTYTEEEKKERSRKQTKYLLRPEVRESQSKKYSGVNNPMYGRCAYDVWVERYGKEVAEERRKLANSKRIVSESGINNHMFGKPAPIGSGNGWSGWYKGWYFRSLHELSYMVNIIEPLGLKWLTAENKKLKIPFVDDKGKNRNYFADFLINDKKLVECKPERLKTTKINIIKFKAAEEFCSKNDFEFEVVTPDIISVDRLKELYSLGYIKFIDKWERRFKGC